MTAVSIFGECSPFHANTEFNYLALSYFGDRPQAAFADFVADEMAPRLGGDPERAARYAEFAKLTAEPAKIPAAVAEIVRIAAEVAADHDAARRWTYLASFLDAYCYEFLRRKTDLI